MKFKAILTLFLVTIWQISMHGQSDIDLSSPSINTNTQKLIKDGDYGSFSFRLNKPLDVKVPVHHFLVSIELKNIKPVNGIQSISGNGAELFEWVYDEDENLLTGTQKKEITGFLFSGNFLVDFLVTGESSKDKPENGFKAIISETMDKYDIVKKNNIVSNYTWTKE